METILKKAGKTHEKIIAPIDNLLPFTWKEIRWIVNR
jgi:hypothetical protein